MLLVVVFSSGSSFFINGFISKGFANILHREDEDEVNMEKKKF